MSYTKRIIDVSRYQGNIDWDKVKAAGVAGAMLKTVSTNNTEFGGLYIDPTFERNYAECKRVGIPVGVYYYTYAQTLDYANKELALFKQAVSGKQFELPLVIDVEDNLLKPLSADALTDLVEHAVKTIESWGCYAMVYTYLNYQNTELNMDRLAKYDLWLAAYRENRPTAPAHSIWQYSSTAKIDGISANCDVNWQYKDHASIIKNAGLNGWGKTETDKDTNVLCKECEELKAQIALMEANHKAESEGWSNVIDGYISDVYKLEEKLATANAKLEETQVELQQSEINKNQLKTENGVLKETIISLQEQLEEARRPKSFWEKVLSIIIGG